MFVAGMFEESRDVLCNGVSMWKLYVQMAFLFQRRGWRIRVSTLH